MTERLFIGGPLDGQWRQVPDHEFQVLAAEEPGIHGVLIPNDAPVKIDQRIVAYWRVEFVIFGRKGSVFLEQGLNHWAIKPNELISRLVSTDGKRTLQ